MRAALPAHGRDQLRDKPNCEPPRRLSLGCEQNGRPIWSKQRHPIRPEACLLLTDGESPVALAIFGFGLGRCIAVHGLESAMGVGGASGMSILPPIIRCAGADAPRTLVSGLLNCARLRAPIAERLSKFYLHRS